MNTFSKLDYSYRIDVIGFVAGTILDEYPSATLMFRHTQSPINHINTVKQFFFLKKVFSNSLLSWELDETDATHVSECYKYKGGAGR